MTPFQMPQLPTPLPRTYWVWDGKLLAGAYAGQPEENAHRKRLEGLFQAGMRTFVNLMEKDEVNNLGQPFAPYEDVLRSIALDANETVECLRFPIIDQHITTNEQMTAILDAIDGSIAGGRPVYVHCFGGIGRTGTVICCWMLRHGIATNENVFDLLQTLREADVERSWREAPENQTQRDFVLDWPEPSTRRESINSFPPADKDDWFTRLVGFSERDPDEVRRHLVVRDDRLISQVNQKSYQIGRLEIISLGELRQRVGVIAKGEPRLKLTETIGDARQLHADPANAGAIFQVASQFNLLEMVSPAVTPERGIGIYEHDPTQGPACAIACGAGTVFRNYFVPLGDQVGQSADRQVDCLAQIGHALGNTDASLWKMRNGYALPTSVGLKEVNVLLNRFSEPDVDELRAQLRVGIQWNTQVTLPGCQHLVSQVYCSAMPVAYSGHSNELWERLATLVLEAAYEATFAAAAIQAARSGNNTLFLTLIGGGAFGNSTDWIIPSIERACRLFRTVDLDVRVVSYCYSKASIQNLVSSVMEGIDIS
ncbi:protein-tyrosine phosphatase family protein [Neorhodopirellula pilleata]|uniref:Dual specificity phosphatase, catalytic domain n=1 Tax=Neorhodopirellula pilleata TaxID=2714738 RepID=A0A5C6A8N5_9BACT|nr:dual specificity protein phosphatase family protein [Neorhodopirellula pilleata]TWT95750.1 Dual specificity phosphatase, catalytic domain [Neorhodopirellula pilleata]